MELLKTFVLFALTAVAEIVGCYLPYLWLKPGRSAWLLSLHPTAAGRVYAAYGGVCIGVAVVWLMLVDKVRPTTTDWVRVAVSLAAIDMHITPYTDLMAADPWPEA